MRSEAIGHAACRGVISRSLELTANATGRFGLVPATHPGSARFRPVRRTLGRYGGGDQSDLPSIHLVKALFAVFGSALILLTRSSRLK